MKKIYLVRHGETVGNVEKFSQLPDTELTHKGREGAQALAARFKDVPVDLLLASPFTRAQQTAERIGEVAKLSVETIDAVHELLRPESVVGKIWNDEVGKIYMQYLKEMWTESSDMEGAENYKDILSRCDAAKKFLDESEAKNIVVVSHGDFLRFFITVLLVGRNASPEVLESTFWSLGRISNVGVSLVSVDGDKWKLDIYNDKSHFPGE